MGKPVQIDLTYQEGTRQNSGRRSEVKTTGVKRSETARKEELAQKQKDTKEARVKDL